MKIFKPKQLTAHLLFFCVLALTFISCKKEAIGTSSTQDQLKTATNTQARAVSFTTNEKIDIALTIFIPCANGGAGEDVLLSGSLHILTSFTINDNNVRGKSHSQPQGISGVGVITGDKYQATGGTQDEFKGSLVNGQFEESFVNNFRIIGQGNGNNYLVHENYHITINANGIVTTVIDNFTADCK